MKTTADKAKPEVIVKETPIVQSLKGSFHVPESFDYKKGLTKGLSKKYLKH